MAKKRKQKHKDEYEPKYTSKSSAYKKLSSMGAKVSGTNVEITPDFLVAYELNTRDRDARQAIINASVFRLKDAKKRLKQLENLASRQKDAPRKELYEDLAQNYSKKVKRLEELFVLDEAKGEMKSFRTRKYISALSSIGSMEAGIKEAFKSPKRFASSMVNARIVAIMANAFARKMFLTEGELVQLEEIAAAFGFDLKGKMETSYANYSRRHTLSRMGEDLARAGESISVFGFGSDQFIQNIVDAAEHLQNILVSEKTKLTDDQKQMINEFFYIYESARGF